MAKQKIRSIGFTEDEISDGCCGGCLSCGDKMWSGIEPDARGYECEVCGEKKVYGAEELLIMGRAHIIMDGEDDFE